MKKSGPQYPGLPYLFRAHAVLDRIRGICINTKYIKGALRDILDFQLLKDL